MDFAIELLNSYLGDSWIAYVTAAVTIFSAIAAVTPTPAEGSIWAKVYKVVDFVALNVGKAKDKADTEVEDKKDA